MDRWRSVVLAKISGSTMPPNPGDCRLSYGQGHRAPRGPLDEAMTGGPEIAQTTALGSAH